MLDFMKAVSAGQCRIPPALLRWPTGYEFYLSETMIAVTIPNMPWGPSA